MKEYIVTLRPRSSFEQEFHSETLFGAICWGIRILFGERTLLDILKQFDVTPPFLVSSAFPYHLEMDEYYLPKPVLNPLKIEDIRAIALERKDKIKKEPYHSEKFSLLNIVQKYKAFNKLKYVTHEYSYKITDKPDERTMFKDYLDGWIKKPLLLEHEAVQKNSLDRLTGSTTGSGNTFYNTEIFFRKGWGLYFLIKTDIFNEKLLPVLKLLEDSGIGSNARTGKNRFEIEYKEAQFTGGNEGNVFMTLSRYLKKEPINMEKSFYNIAPVRSKVESREEFAGEDVWKYRVTYFTEGSLLFPEENRDYYGGILPVKNIAGKTIYQYGYAYPFWITMEAQDVL